MNITLKKSGYGISAWNTVSLTSDWMNGRVNSYYYFTEMTASLITVFGGNYGIAFGIGWELGKHFGPSKWIGDDDTKYFE